MPLCRKATAYGGVASYWIYREDTQKKDMQHLYKFMVETEEINNISSSLKDSFGDIDNNKLITILDSIYSTETRNKIVDLFINYQTRYTKKELQTIFREIEMPEKNVDENISDHQEIIDFHLGLAVAMRDRKNDDVIKIIHTYYQDEKLIVKDNLKYEIELAKQKIALTMGVSWIPWRKK